MKQSLYRLAEFENRFVRSLTGLWPAL